MKNIYYNSQNHLCFDTIDLSSILHNYPTPFYIYSAKEIRKNCDDVLSCAGAIDLMPCYALIANYNLSLIKIIKDMYFGADVVSVGELNFALDNGISPDKIVFAGVGKSKNEISQSISRGVHSINIESESELDLVMKVARQLQKKIVIAIRVNPDIDAKTDPHISTGLHSSKFGVTRKMATRLYRQAKNSGYNEKRKVLVELGRSIVGSAGMMITKILYLKKTPQKKFIIVDFVGPVCETSDFFAQDRDLPIFKEGDYLAITGVGAYGQALSSNNNLRPTIAEHLIDNNRHQNIFEGESIEILALKYNS